MKSCIFCDIVTKKESASIVYEDDEIMAFLPKELEIYGHTLVVTKNHFQSLYDIPKEELSNIMAVIKDLTIRYKTVLGATGMNVLHASGKEAQQSVSHFHIHLLPRYKNDNIDARPNIEQRGLNREEILKKITFG